MIRGGTGSGWGRGETEVRGGEEERVGEVMGKEREGDGEQFSIPQLSRGLGSGWQLYSCPFFFSKWQKFDVFFMFFSYFFMYFYFCFMILLFFSVLLLFFLVYIIFFCFL